MIHPFAELRPEYEHLLSIMTVTKVGLVEQVARKLLRNLPRYAPVAAAPAGFRPPALAPQVKRTPAAAAVRRRPVLD